MSIFVYVFVRFICLCLHGLNCLIQIKRMLKYRYRIEIALFRNGPITTRHRLQRTSAALCVSAAPYTECCNLHVLALTHLHTALPAPSSHPLSCVGESEPTYGRLQVCHSNGSHTVTKNWYIFGWPSASGGTFGRMCRCFRLWVTRVLWLNWKS